LRCPVPSVARSTHDSCSWPSCGRVQGPFWHLAE
jgi:hypothetical protein